MNGFTKKSIGTLTLGEKLKKLRSDKRISLGEVSRATKIQIAYLEYLEECQYEKLPSDVYIKGFLRSYADFLVDEKILLKTYEKEKEIKYNLEKKKKSKKEKKSSINISFFIFTPKKIILLAISLAVICGLVFLFMEINSFADEPSLVVLKPENGSEFSEESIFIEGVTDKDSFLFINEQPILVGDEGKFKESVILQPGNNSINIKAVNKFKKETENNLVVRLNLGEQENKNVESGNANEIKEENKNETSVEKEIQIDLRVDPGPVWLSVEADGSLVFSGTMLTGAVQIFKAKEKIIINSGMGNATFIKFNGQEIGSLSQEPNPVRDVIFTKETKF